MSTKRTMVLIPLTDEQRAQLRPLLSAVEAANQAGVDTGIFAQVWADGLVATLVSGAEVDGVQAVLKPSHPWRGASTAKARMQAHNAATHPGSAD